jgi:hypothetical protein
MSDKLKVGDRVQATVTGEWCDGLIGTVTDIDGTYLVRFDGENETRGHGSGTDLLTGMLIGEAISGGHHHDTAVSHDSAPRYSEPAPSSYDSGSSSGFSYSDSSSSSSYDSGGASYDSGSSGGFDASW